MNMFFTMILQSFFLGTFNLPTEMVKYFFAHVSLFFFGGGGLECEEN